MDKPRISAIVHTRNSAATVEKTLKSLAWVDELLVVDMESNDGTLDIALKHTPDIYHQEPVDRVDGVRNAYLSRAAMEWILVLDSDEFLAEDAERLIRELITEHPEYDAYRIPRYNLIAGQVMRGSGWYPDPQLRLFRRGCVRWSDTHHQIPELTDSRYRLCVLEGPEGLHIHHQNYRDLRHFITKQLQYALSESYPDDPDTFDFGEYISQAYDALAWRSDPESDGDLSHALSLIMAWDRIIRGLIHWDKLDTKPPLPPLSALPIREAPPPSEST